jgi:hypothetical protein
MSSISYGFTTLTVSFSFIQNSGKLLKVIFAYRSIAVESVNFIVQRLFFAMVSQLLLGVGWLTD